MKVRTNNWKKTILVGPGESVDLETVSVYQKPREEGKVEIKAVVMEGGKLKLKGMIRIEKEGVGVNAFLRQDVLLVGEGAVVVAEPQLEIETDEVKASHAAAIGRVDEEQIFYLMTKGLSREEAKQEIIEAFLRDEKELQ